MFVIITGRNLKQLLPEISNYNIKYDYLICNDGGAIYNRKLEEIYKININSNIAEDIYSMLKNDRCINICFINTGKKITTDLTEEASAIIGIYNDYNKAYKLLSKILVKYKDITGYLSQNWINIKSNKATKDQAIDYLINKLSINKESVITVGDSINDESMIEKYNGFAMACSKDEIKKKGRFVVNSVEELIDIIKEED